MKLTKQQIEQIQQIKNHLHRHPELSWEEKKTTAYIREILSQIPHVEILDTPLERGVLAVIRGDKPGGCVALRSDIDAIRGEEEWESEYVSQQKGVAHLCGHDFHTACLLGAIFLLSEKRKELPGTVLCIFQPAEETTNGAEKIMASGVFEQWQVGAIFGLHNRPELPTGQVLAKRGPLMAAKINFEIRLTGVGGHGSMPHKCVDPIVCAAALIQSIQTIPSRNIDPMESIVLSIGSVHGGTPENLIVDQVVMTGSMRTFQPQVEERALQRLQEIIEFTAKVYECGAIFTILEQVPAVRNAAELVPIAEKAIQKVEGLTGIFAGEGCLATEDFAVYMQKVPGFFYWLGARQAEAPCYSWHNSKFHTDDQALPLGAELLAASAWTWLQNRSDN